ncbi:SDR family oxidoreductase [Polaromonas sp.]|uniref:SDR family oxidoreductase n=1 Tax=Polaromonas sp. TaxID=1869339 RepID=UPI002FC886E4
MDTGLNGKRVVVTAGAQGIGLAITGAFVAAGATVHICDVNDDFLADAKRKFPQVSQSHTDVSKADQVDAMFAELTTRWGALDVLVNNAGIAGPTAAVEDTAPGDWEQTIAVNLTGPFLCTRRAVPLLKAAGGGSIVNLSSIAGRLGFPLRTPYSASKFGVIGLTQTWAMELGPSRIRVNAILPGIVAGDRQERVIAAKAASYGIGHEAMRQRLLSKVSLRSMVTAQDIAHQIIFICSPAGASISGQSLSVCGNVEHLG